LPKLIAIWFSGQERGTASGIYFTGVTAGVAVSLSATNSIVLPIVKSWRMCLLIYGILTLIVVIVWVKLARSPSIGNAKASVEDSRMLDAMRELIKHGSIWLVVIVGSTVFVAVHSLNNWLPKILESQEYTATMAGIIAAVFSLFRIVGGLTIPRISRSVISRRLMISIMLFATALSVVAIQSGVELPLWFGIVAGGLCLGAVAPLLLTLLMDMPEVGSEKMGAAGGLYFSFGEIGGVLGPVIIGYLRDVTGSFYTGLTVITVVIGCMAVLSIFTKEA
jgi:CP family cyanate transporter-like MFS transporter